MITEELFMLSDDTAEFNQVNAALISIFKIDAKGECSNGARAVETVLSL